MYWLMMISCGGWFTAASTGQMCGLANILKVAVCRWNKCHCKLPKSREFGLEVSRYSRRDLGYAQNPRDNVVALPLSAVENARVRLRDRLRKSE